MSEQTIESRKATRQDLEVAIRGELESIAGYAELAVMAPTEAERLMYISIIGDEYGHLRVLLSLESRWPKVASVDAALSLEHLQAKRTRRVDLTAMALNSPSSLIAVTA